MKIDVLWTPSELEDLPLVDRTGVVIDVLRAATTVAAAIHNAARTIVPAESTEDALRIANSIGRDQVLLCGERGGVRIDGFELGNSPAEFTAEAIGDRTIVMTTTNGTRALTAMASAHVVYLAALVNLTAVARRLEDGADPLIVCSGREGRVSADDALCAGLLVDAFLKRRRKKKDIALSDGAIAALALARQHASDTPAFLRDTAAGRALEAVGLGDDIEFCARVDSIPVVPVFREHQITPLEPGGTPKRDKARAR